MRLRRGVVPVLVLLLSVFAVKGSAQLLETERATGDRRAIGASGDLADGAAIRLASLSPGSFRESGLDRVNDAQAFVAPIRPIELHPPGGSVAAEVAGMQPADPGPGRRIRSVPESTSFLLLATGFLGVALSRRRFKR